MYSTTSLQVCPRCRATGYQDGLERIPRIVKDRLLSLVRLRHRFRCRATGCGWQGALFVRPQYPL